LRRAGLVTNRKDGLRVYYKVSDAKVFDLIDSASEILQAQWGERLLTPTETRPASPSKLCSCPQCSPVPAC
jgi:hypothetical protein